VTVLARTLFPLLNFVAMVIALAVWFLAPAYAVFVLLGFIGWMALGFVVLGSSWGSRPAGSATRLGSAGAAPKIDGAGRTPSPAAGTPLPSIGFCIYCGTDLTPGTSRCAACGRAVARI
jgi:hypothetical protein